MHYVGVDLAWGRQRPTGIAALDAAGRLVHVEAALTDDEILAAVAPFVADDCVVAFDAPLIVTNATGNRPAEAALNRDFARFEAGAHPSNTGKPELVHPRAAVLSAELGLDLSPHTAATRRALEVYPHPATIALFRLGRTLKYKNKPGRTLETMRAELAMLTELLEGLATADPPLHLADHDDWRALVAAVRGAGRKSELRVAEDQVDAVVCAYVALLADQRPNRVTLYGDADTGYILTPTLPVGHQPSPRLPDPLADPVARAVRDYAELRPALVPAAEAAVELVTGLLDDAGINYLAVTGRAKTIASFAAKVGRFLAATPDADPLTDMTDLVGVRVVAYVHGDVDAVATLLHEELDVHDDRDLGEETASQGRFGYASRHLQARLRPAAQPLHPSIGARQVQVQLRTVLQHAWAEFEHDIRYKGSVPDEHTHDLDRRFTLAAGLLELADREFSEIRDRLRSHLAEQENDGELAEDPRITAPELAAFLAGQYADADWSRTDHYVWISGLLLELGITSLSELAEVIRRIDTGALEAKLGYRQRTGAVRRLDDVLLAAYAERYVQLRGNSHRTALLTDRLSKMTAAGA